MRDTPHLRRWRRQRPHGFTLVELVVALTAGLLVSGAAYLLARNSMRSYQDESRIASGQVAASAGLSRLQADLQRAGYMSSPNITADPSLCSGTFLPADVPIQALQFECDDNPGLSADFGYEDVTQNPMDEPDTVVISGNMTSTEQLEYRVVDGDTVHLAMDRGPMQRLLQSVGNNGAAFSEVFVHTDADGNTYPRLARIVDQSGKQSYVLVTAVTPTVVAGTITEASLTITDPSGGTPTNAGTECGYVNRGTGLINPVSIIRYRIGQICDPYDGGCQTSAFGPAIGAKGPTVVTGESVRSELLREELTPAAAKANPFNVTLTVGGGLISQEIAAEFAVDLDFAAVYAIDPVVPTLGFKDFTEGDDIENDATVAPQRFRSLRVRFATRARVPDRDERGATDPVTRFFLSPVVGKNKFARMRTLYTEVQLPNLAQVRW